MRFRRRYEGFTRISVTTSFVTGGGGAVAQLVEALSYKQQVARSNLNEIIF
jgi:hypothetical protein